MVDTFNVMIDAFDRADSLEPIKKVRRYPSRRRTLYLGLDPRRSFRRAGSVHRFALSIARGEQKPRFLNATRSSDRSADFLIEMMIDAGEPHKVNGPARSAEGLKFRETGIVQAILEERSDGVGEKRQETLPMAVIHPSPKGQSDWKTLQKPVLLWAIPALGSGRSSTLQGRQGRVRSGAKSVHHSAHIASGGDHDPSPEGV